MVQIPAAVGLPFQGTADKQQSQRHSIENACQNLSTGLGGKSSLGSALRKRYSRCWIIIAERQTAKPKIGIGDQSKLS